MVLNALNKCPIGSYFQPLRRHKTNTFVRFCFRASSPTLFLVYSSVINWWYVSIANNGRKWALWSTSARVSPPYELWDDPRASEIINQLDTICQRIRYPGSIRHLSKEQDRWTAYREEETFLQEIVKWSESITPDLWDDNLSPDVLKLFFGWLTFRSALDSKSDEVAQRSLADMLVQAVFSERLVDKSPHIT